MRKVRHRGINEVTRTWRDAFLWAHLSILSKICGKRYSLSKLLGGKTHFQFYLLTKMKYVQFTHSVMADSLWPHGLQKARLPCPSPTLGDCSNSCPLSQWRHPTIYPLSSPSSPTFNLSQHQGLFKWLNSSHQVAKVLELQHQSFQWIFRADFLYEGLVGSSCSPRDSQESSPIPQFKSINCLVLSFLYSPTLTSIHDYWKNHNFD